MSQTKAQLLGPVLGDVNYDSGTLFVDSANNRVGIGTTNPLTPLNVVGGVTRLTNGLKSSSNTYLQLWSSDASNQMIMSIANGGNQYWQIQSTEQDVNWRSLSLNPSGGNVGIGITNPSSKLHLAETTSAANFTLSNNINNWSITTGSSANSFSIIENQFGSNVFHVTSAVNLGIGTTNPDGKLEVRYNAGSLTSTPEVTTTFIRADGTYNPRIQIRHSASGSDINHTYSNFAADMSISIGNDEKIRIKSSGNIGIGTTNPANTLHVQGISRFANSSNNLIVSTDAGNPFVYVEQNAPLLIGTNSTARITIGASGNVGIGTTNPSTLLHLKRAAADGGTLITQETGGTVEVSDIIAGFNGYSADASTTSSGGVGGILLRSETAFNTSLTPTYLTFHTHPNSANNATQFGNTQERMRITASGNVGIGVTNPSSRFTIKSPGASTTFLSALNSGNTSILRLTQTAGGSGYLELRDSTDDTFMVMDAANRTVGISTSSPSNTTLHVVGNHPGGHSAVKIQRTDTSITSLGFYSQSGNRDGIIYTDNNANLALESVANMIFAVNNGNSAITIKSDQNVGIGTGNPSDKLHIHSTQNSNFLITHPTASIVHRVWSGAYTTNDAAGVRPWVVYQRGGSLEYELKYQIGLGVNWPAYPETYTYLEFPTGASTWMQAIVVEVIGGNWNYGQMAGYGRWYLSSVANSWQFNQLEYYNRIGFNITPYATPQGTAKVRIGFQSTTAWNNYHITLRSTHPNVLSGFNYTNTTTNPF